jgi:hypothetical protein
MDSLSKRFAVITGVVLGFAACAAPASPDEVLLRGGGRVSGVIVERTAQSVAIETGPGRVTLPMSRVEKVMESDSFVAEYHARAARLDPRDALGWAALARWAGDRDLLTLEADAWRHVLAIDPSHPEANAALGRVEVGGVWMSAENGNRARGLVPYEGRWLTPAEHEAAVRERAFEEASALEQREADLRLREAEARAREAEARAREAEAAASEATSDTGGIPLWWAVYGSGVPAPYGHPSHGNPYAPSYGPTYGPTYGPSSGGGDRGGHQGQPSRSHGHNTTPTPQPTPAPSAPPSLRPPPSSSSQQRSGALGPGPRPEPRQH